MLSQGLPGKYGWGMFGGGGVSGFRLGCGFARSFVYFTLLASDQGLVREVLMHPRKMVVAGLHDSLGVPQWHVLLFEMCLHQRRVYLVDVTEPHDHTVGDATGGLDPG